jgi:hypothetical protein
MKRLFCLPVSLILILTVSCERTRLNSAKSDPPFRYVSSVAESPGKTIEKNEVFYRVVTPIEACDLFNRLGVKFSKDIINPSSNDDKYLSISKVALNTGIYGVDFGYLRMSGLGQEVIRYMLSIQSLCDRLGVPLDYLSEPVREIQSGMSDRDSIMTLMNSAYVKVENHLRTGGRESTAGLMLMAGWVEALYIATRQLYDPSNPDPEIIRRIAEQKYTLNSLMSLLKNYYDDPAVSYYLRKLKHLKVSFDKLDITYRKGDIEIDTARQVLRSSGSELSGTIETLNDLTRHVSELRTEIITP